MTVSVCDDPKKYCKQETFNIVVQLGKSTEARMVVPPSLETLKMQKELKKKTMTGFHTLSPEEAQAQAQGKKAILVVYSAEWCPPCNMSKEFLFAHPQFSEAMKDLFLVYVDGDAPSAADWAPHIDAHYYPSFVLLNHKLEAIALKAGWMPLFKMNSWVHKSLAAGVTLAELEAAVQKRQGGSFMQKVFDYFKGKDVAETEARTLAETYFQKAKASEAVALVEAFKLKEFAGALLEQKIGDTDEEKEPEEFKALAREFLKSIDTNPEFNPYILQSLCGNEKESEERQTLCKKAVVDAMRVTEEQARKDWDKLSEGERALTMAGAASSLLDLKALEDPKNPNIKKIGQTCLLSYQSLTKYSPLKEKSRVARMGQLGCDFEGESITKDVDLLQGLIADYPFEETFYRRLASHYKKKKNYKRALELNSFAMKYSYGVVWLRNVMTRAKILEEMKKPEEAFALLKKNMQEVKIQESGRHARVFKSLRDQL